MALFPMSKSQLGRQVYLPLVTLLPARDLQALPATSIMHSHYAYKPKPVTGTIFDLLSITTNRPAFQYKVLANILKAKFPLWTFQFLKHIKIFLSLTGKRNHHIPFYGFLTYLFKILSKMGGVIYKIYKMKKYN